MLVSVCAQMPLVGPVSLKVNGHAKIKENKPLETGGREMGSELSVVGLTVALMGLVVIALAISKPFPL